MSRKFRYFKKPAVLFVIAAMSVVIAITYFNTDYFSGLQFYIGINKEYNLMSLSFHCENPEPQVKSITEPFSALVVQTCGNIIERIRQFNAALDSIRIQKLKAHRKITNWTFSNNITLLGEWNDDYFESLSNFPQVTLVILPWLRKIGENDIDWSSLHDDTNLPIHEYYESTGSDTLCKLVESPDLIDISFGAVNNWTCNRNTTRGALPQSISRLALNAKPIHINYFFPAAYPTKFFNELPSVLYSLYIVESGTIDWNGDVFIKNAKIVPHACSADRTLNPSKDYESFPIYDEVFVISQRFGSLIYHRLAENIPRIAVLVDFLKRNPNIRIHAPDRIEQVREYLSILGIDASRAFNGFCRAEIVYLPRGMMCVLPHFLETQILSRQFRHYMKSNYPPVQRNKIIVIRRSNHRYFRNQIEIENVVKQAAMDYNLTYETFRDDPLPTIPNIMRLFQSALMVVGPHGAGFGNLVFSDPGTFVIEGICNPPIAFLFFQRTALVLGHRYHGIPSTGGCNGTVHLGVTGVVTIEPSIINTTVRTYLDILAHEKSKNYFSAELTL